MLRRFYILFKAANTTATEHSNDDTVVRCGEWDNRTETALAARVLATTAAATTTAYHNGRPTPSKEAASAGTGMSHAVGGVGENDHTIAVISKHSQNRHTDEGIGRTCDNTQTAVVNRPSGHIVSNGKETAPTGL